MTRCTRGQRLLHAAKRLDMLLDLPVARHAERVQANHDRREMSRERVALLWSDTAKHRRHWRCQCGRRAYLQLLLTVVRE